MSGMGAEGVGRRSQKKGIYICVRVSMCAQFCPTLCDPRDCSPPCPSIHGILQTRILEWVAISFSRGYSQPKDRMSISCISCHWQADSLLLHKLGSLINAESACHTGDPGLIPGLGKSPRDGKGYPLQYSCLENSMERGAWWATVHVVAESRTRLNN